MMTYIAGKKIKPRKRWLINARSRERKKTGGGSAKPSI